MPELKNEFKRLLPWLCGAVAIIAVDQWTKLLVVERFARYERLPVLPFFDLTLTYNPGAAFSFLAHHDGWQRFLFIAIALVASVVIIHLMRKYIDDRLFCAGLTLILGGAIGNLWDRIVLGEVVDFLLFYWGERQFPAFNLADSAITAGAAIVIWHSLRGEKKNG